MPSITFSSPKVYREGIRFRSSNNCNNIDGNEKENNLETTQRLFHPIRFLKSTLRSRHNNGEDRNDVEDIGVEPTLQSHDHERFEQAEVKSETREECEEAKEEIRAEEDVKIDAIEHSERVNKQDDDPPEQKTRVDGNNESEGAEDEPHIDSETKQPNEDTNAFTATPLQTRQFKKLGPGVHVLSPRDAAKFYEQNFGSPIQSGNMLNGGINVSPCVNFPSTNYFAAGSPPIYYYYGGCTFETSQATQFAQNTNFNQSQFSERNVPEVEYPPGYDPEIRFDSGEYFESHSEQSYRSEPEVKFPHGYDPEIHFDSEHDKKSFEGVQTWSENFSMNHFPGARQPQHFYEMIPLGTAVFLRGLISAGNHNGDRGVIMQYSSATQRYLVELGETGETVSVKPENILQQIHVKIHGIISQPDLNGCIGLIWYTENKYRYSIYIASLEKFASIKPENVMLEKGTVARVWRLEHRQELNGKWGTIKNWIEESNKYDIQLSENQMIRVKAEHVML